MNRNWQDSMTSKKIPLYLKELYGDFYNNEALFSWADKEWVKALLSFGCRNTLVNAVLKEVVPGLKTLQLGCTFGDQMEQTAKKVGINGMYDILDISQIQLKRAKKKLAFQATPIRYFQQNANTALKKNYDLVILFMLLHEVPHIQKAKILQAALDSLREGGKVVIIDYHNPVWWHPLRYIVKLFNRLYRPFTEVLWDREVDTFVKNKADFIWKKSLYFGNMYQKVVIEKKYKDEYL